MFAHCITETMELVAKDEGLMCRFLSLRQEHHQRIYGSKINSLTTGYYNVPHATTFTPFGGCPRAICYRAHNVTESDPPDGHSQMIFDSGSMYEAQVAAMLEMAGVLDQGGGRVFEFEGIPARPDYLAWPCWEGWERDFETAFGLKPGANVPIEIKSAGFTSFNRIKEDGMRVASPHYYSQLQMYLAATGQPVGVFLVIHKDTSALYEEVVELDPAAIRELKNLVWVGLNQEPESQRRLELEPVIEYIAGKDEPAGPYTSREPRWSGHTPPRLLGWNCERGDQFKLPPTCAYCGHRSLCWSEYALDFVGNDRGGGYYRAEVRF